MQPLTGSIWKEPWTEIKRGIRWLGNLMLNTTGVIAIAIAILFRRRKKPPPNQ